MTRFFALALILLSAVISNPATPPDTKRNAVIVELFTSEGCSSCPPADALLTRLEHNPSANGTEIIPLGFHVDYWNSLGWRDRFSSHAFTERQEKYAASFRQGPYTPQMVVDGQDQFVGNDSAAAENAILQAAARRPQVEVQLSWTAANKLLAAVTGENTSSGQVLLAITEDGLSSNVAAGENDGRLLQHSAVVRDFRILGQLKNGRWQGEATVKPAKDWKPADLKLVVFVQREPVGEIEGAASIGLQKQPQKIYDKER